MFADRPSRQSLFLTNWMFPKRGFTHYEACRISYKQTENSPWESQCNAYTNKHTTSEDAVAWAHGYSSLQAVEFVWALKTEGLQNVCPTD